MQIRAKTKAARSMNFCIHCGSHVEGRMNFCPKCGARIVREFLTVPLEDETASIGEQRAEGEELLERPFREIKTEVESFGFRYESLPEPVKRILSRRDCYVVRYKLFEEQEGDYGKSADQLVLEPLVISSLKEIGTEKLYRFQEEAIWSILKGENVVITAPTGNGKTLAFAIPIFHSIISQRKQEGEDGFRSTKALFVYPTKALARDQLRILRQLSGTELSVAIFDGDTPAEQRRLIVESPPDIIISNFDTLEYHLRNRTSFSGLLKDLRFVVIDELHTYLGAFGSHVFFILRRLRRVSRNRDKIQFIGSSATVRNPKQFAELLFNSEVTEIKCERGRRGRIHFIMLYPSKTSMTGMMVGCVRTLLAAGMKTLVFANTHKNAEVLNLALKREGLGSEIHRAGLLRDQRTEVEQSFKNGSLKSLVATPTLELGIDIGDLDSVVSMITGITTLTQRMGRAGRKGQESVVVLSLRNEDPISAFYKNHPATYFSDINAAYVEPNNPVVARLELLAAAMDMPLHPSEFSDQSEMLTQLKKEAFLEERMGRLWPSHAATKEVSKMSIRGIGESVTILDAGREENTHRIGERGMPMALRELFPHAVYLLAGRKYESMSFQNVGGLYYASVKRLPDSFLHKTEALRHSDPRIIKVLEKKSLRGMEVSYCELTMTEVIDGYILKEMFTDKRVGPTRMLLEPLKYTYPTKGFVFSAPQPSKKFLSRSKVKTKQIVEEKEEEDPISGSFHALEHALIESSDSITGSGSSEIGGVSMGNSGAIFVYDGGPGGSGLTRLLFDRLDEAFARTLSILKECKCTSRDGCPLCTYSYQCGNNNDPLNKLGAIDSLEQIIKGASTRIKEDQFIQEKSYL